MVVTIAKMRTAMMMTGRQATGAVTIKQMAPSPTKLCCDFLTRTTSSETCLPFQYERQQTSLQQLLSNLEATQFVTA